MNIKELLSQIREIIPIMAGLALVSASYNLIATLTSYYLEQQNISNIIIGLSATAFYAGLTIGAFIIEPFIIRVGHIRAFVTFSH